MELLVDPVVDLEALMQQLPEQVVLAQSVRDMLVVMLALEAELLIRAEQVGAVLVLLQ
jgi:hypothetical protein